MSKPKTNTANAATGVGYAELDPFKVACQKASSETDNFAEHLGFTGVPWSRGESVFLIWSEQLNTYLGLVIEGLGTKALVADYTAKQMRTIANSISTVDKSYYDHIAICNAAMAFNDLIVLGLRPIVYNQYVAVSNSAWFQNIRRSQDLIAGTKEACRQARCIWGGGETPELNGIIMPGAVDLAGATIGISQGKDQLINPANLRPGTAIVIVESSGIHANGLSKGRTIADGLPKSYRTVLPDGRTYGETLLDPTHIYVKLVTDCLDAGVNIRYAVNITGHGWRKLMRAPQSFTYVIDELPTELPIFDFIKKHGKIKDRDMYGAFNMGAGFALFVPKSQVATVIKKARLDGKRAFCAGVVEKGKKRVVIKPKKLEYADDTLQLR